MPPAKGGEPSGAVLAVAAEPLEFEGLIRVSQAWIRLKWPIGFSSGLELNGRRWIVVANGPGPRLAHEAVAVALARARVDLILSTGFCGALDPALQPGEVFVASHMVSRGRVQMPSRCRSYVSGSLISRDRVAVTAREKGELRTTGASVVDMETEALAEAASTAQLPFYCVRAVSDCACEDLPLDFNVMRDARGRLSRMRILSALIHRPTRIPKLLRFQQRCRTASHNLGVFLAGCEF